MSEPAQDGEHASAKERLQSDIRALSEIAEEPQGLQPLVREQSAHLERLIKAISGTLNDIYTGHTDKAIRVAARKRRLAYDEKIEPILAHMTYREEDRTQESEAWARHRRRLRAELDVLAEWASALIIATYVIAAGSASGRFPDTSQPAQDSHMPGHRWHAG